MALTPTTIKRFRGIDQLTALTATVPEFAIDCVNVIPSRSGGLEKLRFPVTLTEEIVGLGVGPESFHMYENTTNKQVLAFFGSQIYVFQLDGFTPTLIDSNALNIGTWSLVVSNSLALFANGTRVLKWDAVSIKVWGFTMAAHTPTIDSTATAGLVTLAVGRRYRVAPKDTVSGHVGTSSAVSASTGPVTLRRIDASITASADPQVNAYRWYSTLDGGDDYFFNQETATPTIQDNQTDDDLDQSERAPLINDPAPVGYYIAQWGTRTFMFRLDDDPQGIAFSGYNRIFVGRPEQSFPPSNRLRLATGADVLAGGGVIAAGIVAFDVSDRMYMYRGHPEDITNTSPVEFTSVLQELPWGIGCASHFTIVSTGEGLIWLSPDRKVYRFDGAGKPQILSTGVESLMRRINPILIRNSRGAYWSYINREWYVLAVALDNSSGLDRLLIFDLTANPEENAGVFPLDIGEFQSVNVLSLMDGTQKLAIGQAGRLKEIIAVSDTTNGITDEYEATDETLGAYWQSGYFGNEESHAIKQFTSARLVSDQTGFRVKRRLIREDVRNPEFIEFEAVRNDGKISTQRKGRRLSFEFRFPDEDTACNVLEFSSMHIPVSVR